ncbi:hypothetical protein ABEV74_13445 [Paenibacillus cisolokensis]|uniref:hypothetical protein n=1 Tax=Paenibacillus cisolokensis TaxID=1658519 RepID=UPI003D269443
MGNGRRFGRSGAGGQWQTVWRETRRSGKGGRVAGDEADGQWLTVWRETRRMGGKTDKRRPPDSAGMRHGLLAKSSPARQ